MDIQIVKDVYFENSRKVAQKKGWNPKTKYNVFIRHNEPFMIGGFKFIEPLLKEYTESYELCYKDGDIVPAGMATLFTYIGPYIGIGEIEGHIIGMISETTRALNLHMLPLTKAAGDVPWLYFGARHRAPEVDIYWSYAALLGGALGIASVPTADKLGVKAYGTMPHALMLVSGSTLKAAIGYGETFEDKDIMILPDTFGMEITDTLECLEYFGKRLVGTRLDTNGGRYCEGCGVQDDLYYDLMKKFWELHAQGKVTQEEFDKYVIGKGVTVEAAIRMRRATDAKNGSHVKNVLTSGYNVRKIEVSKLFNTPMDLLGIGVSEPFMATSDIVEKTDENGNWIRCSKVGRYDEAYDENGRFVPIK